MLSVSATVYLAGARAGPRDRGRAGHRQGRIASFRRGARRDRADRAGRSARDQAARGDRRRRGALLAGKGEQPAPRGDEPRRVAAIHACQGARARAGGSAGAAHRGGVEARHAVES